MSSPRSIKWEWNIPNCLTVLRLILIPFLLYFLILGTLDSLKVTCILYAVIAITDKLDGWLARKLNQQSEFGAYLDPLVDKFVVLGVFVVFIFNKNLRIDWWLVLLIALRDLAVTLMRSNFKRRGIYFKTSGIAQAKTAFQMLVITLILIYITVTLWIADARQLPPTDYTAIWKLLTPEFYSVIIRLPLTLTVLMVLFTIYTGLDYIFRYLILKRKEGKREGSME